VLYAISAVYFAGVMVRLMLTLTPVVCMLSGVAFSCLLEVFLKEDPSATSSKDETGEKEETQPEKKQLYDKVSS
jgi:dolichyl-diphosphooligosaccharide---protein glycosyltransferase